MENESNPLEPYKYVIMRDKNKENKQKKENSTKYNI